MTTVLLSIGFTIIALLPLFAYLTLRITPMLQEFSSHDELTEYITDTLDIFGNSEEFDIEAIIDAVSVFRGSDNKYIITVGIFDFIDIAHDNRDLY